MNNLFWSFKFLCLSNHWIKGLGGGEKGGVFNIKVLNFFTKNYLISKELSLCHNLKFSNPYIYRIWCFRLLIFQTKIIWCNKIHRLKYLKSTTFGCRDIGIRKSEFVSMTQLLCHLRISECDHWRKTKIKMCLIRKIILMWGQLPKK